MSNNLAPLVDRILILDAEVSALSKDLKTAKDEIKHLGPDVYAGDLGTVTVRKNKDSESFDAAAAFEYIAEHLSPQMLSAVRRKFTVTKEGATVLTVKAKVPTKVIA